MTDCPVQVYTIGMVKRIPSDAELELLVLVDREVSGRQVAQLYEKVTGRKIAVGTLYTTLRRMAAVGWVRMRKAGEKDPDSRARYYRQTAAGRRALRDGREHHRRLATFGLERSRDQRE